MEKISLKSENPRAADLAFGILYKNNYSMFLQIAKSVCCDKRLTDRTETAKDILQMTLTQYYSNPTTFISLNNAEVNLEEDFIRKLKAQMEVEFKEWMKMYYGHEIKSVIRWDDIYEGRYMITEEIDNDKEAIRDKQLSMLKREIKKLSKKERTVLLVSAGNHTRSEDLDKLFDEFGTKRANKRQIKCRALKKLRKSLLDKFLRMH